MTGMMSRVGWIVAGALALLVVAALSGVVTGGPLDPPGAPAPTGKTLDQIPGSWDRKLAADDGVGGNPGCNSSRFQCGELGVLDRETGLVWQLDPNCCAPGTWAGQKGSCTQRQVSGREGWRLPTVEELASLVQRFVGPPVLPPGHPFQISAADAYWTATSDTSTTAWTIDFVGTGIPMSDLKANTNLAWCVRGGQAYDGQQ